MKAFYRYCGLCLAFFLLAGMASAQDDTNTFDFPGRIAFIGDDRNVYLFSPDEGTTEALTSNAFMGEGELRYYTWPTWSRDGRLAYFSIVDSTTTPITTEIYVSSDGTQSGVLIYSGEQEVFNYASWSPGNCSDSENCRALSILMNSTGGGGLFVEIVKDQVDGNPSEVIGRGGPFYYSWSPSGDQMLWQRNNRRMDIYDVDDGDVTVELEQTPGIFQAPSWSPVDDRWLVGELDAEAGKTDLIVLTESKQATLVEGLEGIVSFAWSPDGEYIAYVNGNNPLVVIDSVSGDVVARTFEGGISSFFWSPDSARIAYITLATPPDSATAKGGMLMAPTAQDVQIAWSVLDVTSGDVNRYGAFTPTRDFVYMLTYFDQFAQSHRVWSPDGRYIVYSEVVDDEPLINVLDTHLNDTVPLAIGNGTLAVWSYDE